MVSKLWFKVMHTRYATKPIRLTRQEKIHQATRQQDVLDYLQLVIHNKIVADYAQSLKNN